MRKSGLNSVEWLSHLSVEHDGSEEMVTKGPENKVGKHSLIVYQAIQLLFSLSFLSSIGPLSYLLAFCSHTPS